MLTAALVLLGLALITLTVGHRAVERLPLSPALVYLLLGWFAGMTLGAPSPETLVAHAPALAVVCELVVLASLFSVGLRLRIPPALRVWRAALWLAGPGMVVATAFGAAAAMWLLQMPWAPALLLGAVLAPTDPVLASEVQIRSDSDRDAVRLSLTAEGGLNDGTSFPAVMLALALMGLHTPDTTAGLPWWWADMLLPMGGGALLGAALGLLLGRALRWRLRLGDTLARDELLYAGAVTLAYGLARATDTSAFIAVFALGATLMQPLHGGESPSAGQALGDRMLAFGARGERLVEAASVLAVGIALNSVPLTWPTFAFGLMLVFVVRPLSVLAVVRRSMMTPRQRALVAWFGIRGVGSLFYLTFALAAGVEGELAAQLISATLVAIAASIVLHGVSATPLMAGYQQRIRSRAGRGGRWGARSAERAGETAPAAADADAAPRVIGDGAADDAKP